MTLDELISELMDYQKQDGDRTIFIQDRLSTNYGISEVFEDEDGKLIIDQGEATSE